MTILLIKSGLHDLKSLQGVGFDRDGDACLMITSMYTHSPEKVSSCEEFHFKNPKQIKELRDWLNSLLEQTSEGV